MQPFYHFCAAQKTRIRHKVSLQPGYYREKVAEEMEDIYEGPADLNHEMVMEYRQGHQTTFRDVVGVERPMSRFTA